MFGVTRCSTRHRLPPFCRNYAIIEKGKKGVKEQMLKVRNIGIIAHVDAGKTTTCERMLYYSGTSNRCGNVDTGDTVMDYMDLERSRGITINSAAITFKWNGHTINVIDTPGHVDFTVEVERAIRVLDGAVTILDAVSGVQAQTETVWNQARFYNVPSLVYINKMDREGASFSNTINSIESRLYIKTFPIQIPIGVSRSFSGVVDLLSMEEVRWMSEDYGWEMTRCAVTDTSLLMRAVQAREKLVESLASVDETLMDICLEVEKPSDITATQIKEALRRVCLSRKGVVVLCGSSLKNKGVQPILDGVVDYLPSPIEKMPPEAFDSEGKPVTIKLDEQSHLVALAFKVVHDHRKGLVTYLRVYSGVLVAAQKIYNTKSKQTERPLKLFRLLADDMEPIQQVSAGDIAAAVGMKRASTGDTLVGHNDPHVVLKGINLPQPVFFSSILPEQASAEEELDEVLKNLQLEDPSVRVVSNKETGQKLICTMGELHMEIIKHRIQTHYKINTIMGDLYIAYRSTLAIPVEETYKSSFVSASGRTESSTFIISLKRNSEETNKFSVFFFFRMWD
eukprot:TRINITY_DN4929_c0_g2_i1.p1 TRINITY_DN4929_c0_g2~~TRINITY_DN4929_c0_g2_i1.p1  ORF type:complete len:566 (+),score=107.43 TRINITY_DN4929_c0_g2_i1:63-1760(+)